MLFSCDPFPPNRSQDRTAGAADLVALRAAFFMAGTHNPCLCTGRVMRSVQAYEIQRKTRKSKGISRHQESRDLEESQAVGLHCRNADMQRHKAAHLLVHELRMHAAAFCYSLMPTPNAKSDLRNNAYQSRSPHQHIAQDASCFRDQNPCLVFALITHFLLASL
mmetsp:Transcript_13061/g.36043  ORF Transcript_13061/g.36043 Transcript_13061/m.36043 type:complete len:164 (-) Transcript_13061:117-608(-)